MKIFRAVALIAVLAAPAYAQGPTVNLMPDVKSRTPEEKELDAINDKAYRESLRKIPDAKAAADPWGTVRSDASKPTAAKSGAKSGAKSAAKSGTAN